MKVLTRALPVLAIVMALAPVARAGGSGMLIGASEDAGKSASATWTGSPAAPALPPPARCRA